MILLFVITCFLFHHRSQLFLGTYPDLIIHFQPVNGRLTLLLQLRSFMSSSTLFLSAYNDYYSFQITFVEATKTS